MFRKNRLLFKFLLLLLVILIPFITFHSMCFIKNYKYLKKNEYKDYEILAESFSAAFMKYITDIWVIEESTGENLTKRSNIPESEIKDVLRRIKGMQPDLKGTFLLDAEGNLLASSEGEVYNSTLLPESILYEIQNGKDHTISDLYKSNFDHSQRILWIAHSIKSDNQLVGIMAAVIAADELVQMLPEFKIDRNKSILLTDSSGMIVFNSDAKTAAAEQREIIRKFAAADQTINGAIEGVSDEHDDKAGPVEMSVNYPIPEINWSLKVTSPVDQTEAFNSQGLFKQAIVMLIVLTYMIIVSIYLMDKFFEPIIALELAAKKIMNGDYSERTNIRNSGEVGLIAQALDKMAENMEQQYVYQTQIFTNISHELKTPLNVMFASVQLVESYSDKNLDPEAYKNKVSKQIKVIHQNCYRIMRIIGNLMDIGRHESGFLKANLNNYNIVDLARKITLSVERYTEAKGIQLSFTSELESQIMACDPDMIERILLNLISNAVKFTDNGGTITVHIRGDQNNVYIHVRDSGTGIPKEKLKNIFQRFGKGDDPFQRNQEGSGIGLYLVKAFVEAHGGIISVASEEKKGTEFYISLPVRLVENALLPENNVQGSVKSALAAGSSNLVSHINIEFSDIYSFSDNDT